MQQLPQPHFIGDGPGEAAQKVHRGFLCTLVDRSQGTERPG